jgi:hypothetical protein
MVNIMMHASLLDSGSRYAAECLREPRHVERGMFDKPAMQAHACLLIICLANGLHVSHPSLYRANRM